MRINILQVFFIWVCFFISKAQNESASDVLSLEAYLAFVKQYHPLVKQADLQLTAAQAEILQARGGFDPKIEVDYEKKQFIGTEYFDILNSTFKIPTWYGIEIKAAFDQMEGSFLNPQNKLPDAGLATLGIKVPLGQGLFIDQRMADLRKAKLFNQQTQAERQLVLADVFYEAIVTYLNWKRSYEEQELFNFFLSNVQVRFDGVKSLISAGDRPAIDSVETKIILKSRKLSLEQSQLKFLKATLELSNFLWLDNNIPVELNLNMKPAEATEEELAKVIIDEESMAFPNLDDHPKLLALQNKIDILKVEQRLKGDMIKPRLDVQYNFLSEPVLFNEWNVNNYKIGANFSFPLFVRKERGAYRLAKVKTQDAEFDFSLERLQLNNKINFQTEAIVSLKNQLSIAKELEEDNKIMLDSEERLFFFGESSIFLINARENNLLQANLGRIKVSFEFLESHAEFYRVLGRID